MEAAMETGATAIPVPLKRPLPLRPVAVEAHLCSWVPERDFSDQRQLQIDLEKDNPPEEK